MASIRPLIAGNWKMNMDLGGSINLVKAIASNIQDIDDVDVLVAPPFTSISAVREAIQGTGILLGGQNMHWEMEGAYTGEISGKMLLDAGCTHVILGHSERRLHFNETNQTIDLKLQSALNLGLIPIVCIGETLEERQAGRTFQVLEEQLEGCLLNVKTQENTSSSPFILAYEPVWAIGTGETATPDQAQEVHHFVRNWIDKGFGTQWATQLRILYGGSVKPENVAALMARPDIDGALVGGASLKAESFVELVRLGRG